ncbi:MAG: transcriptional repressor, partial [Desulfobacteraceae bacterium]|nr:transcriptional repressor [Desulfobacteraceae bacterium]
IIKKEIKMRHTRQRKLIFDCLRQTNSHPTASEIYDRVRRDLPRISLGTVYRNLENLCSLGLARKIETFGGQKRFDTTVEDHMHAICTRCGKVRDIKEGPEINPEDLKRIDSGFKITGVRIDVLGICPECMKNTNNNEEEK